MLVRVEDEGALAIGQLSHAWLSGQLARAWGNARFGGVEPHEEIALGAEQHDIGWALFDLEPRLSADTGLPRNFLETSVEEHLTIWRGAPDRLRTQSLHAALVVSLHGSALSQLRAHSAPDQSASLREHAAEERARQERLRATLGLSPEQTKRIQRQMWTWDGLSLALCSGWRPFTSREVPTAEGLLDIELSDLGDDGTCTLRPWPFAAASVRVRCEARRLARRYEDEAEMRAAYAQASPLTLEWMLVESDG